MVASQHRQQSEGGQQVVALERSSFAEDLHGKVEESIRDGDRSHADARQAKLLR